MVILCKIQRIEILIIIIGCWDRTSTPQQVYDLFNTKLPDRTISRSNVKLDVLLCGNDNPHNIYRSLLRFLKDEKYHPYKISYIKNWTKMIPIAVYIFVTYFAGFNRNRLIKQIIFSSDEATFYLNVSINRQKSRYCSKNNLHKMKESDNQHHQKIIVWVGIAHRIWLYHWYL